MRLQNINTRCKAQDARCKSQGARLEPCALHLVSCPSKGFSLIELMVVIAIVAVLANALFDRVWLYQEQAEKTAMEQVAGALQSALVLRYGQMLTGGKEREVGILSTENPITWLMKKPANYAGEFFAPTPGAIAPGNWAFDLKNRELVYVPYRTAYFVAGSHGHKWVRYRITMLYESAAGALNKNKGAKSVTGVLFEPVEAYQWMAQVDGKYIE